MEQLPNDGRYAVCSTVRGRGNRTLRAAAPQHARFTQFILPKQYRLIRNRPVIITEEELLTNLKELQAKAKAGILEVRTNLGRRLVDLDVVASAVSEAAELVQLSEPPPAAPPMGDEAPPPPADEPPPAEEPAVETSGEAPPADPEPPLEAAPPVMQVPAEAIAPPEPTPLAPHPPLDSAANDYVGGEFIPSFEGAEKPEEDQPEPPMAGVDEPEPAELVNVPVAAIPPSLGAAKPEGKGKRGRGR